MTADGKPDKNNGQNIILMEVTPKDSVQRGGRDKNSNKSPETYIIGGYASHEWKVNNSEKGDETCFLFNLTQNLRFNARPGAQFYQKTEIRKTRDVDYIKFGTTDLVIEGSKFKYVTSMITPANQASHDNNASRMEYAGGRNFNNNNNSMSGGQNQSTGVPSCFSFGNDLMPTNSVSSIVPGHHRFEINKLEVWQLY